MITLRNGVKIGRVNNGIIKDKLGRKLGYIMTNGKVKTTSGVTLGYISNGK